MISSERGSRGGRVRLVKIVSASDADRSGLVRTLTRELAEQRRVIQELRRSLLHLSLLLGASRNTGPLDGEPMLVCEPAAGMAAAGSDELDRAKLTITNRRCEFSPMGREYMRYILMCNK